jgi:hypothetical protein
MLSHSSPALRRLLKLAQVAIQGNLTEVMVRCGKPTCACAQDPSRRHGPSLYFKYRDSEGRSKTLYIPRAYEAEVEAAVAAWGEMWQAMLERSQANREALAQRVRRKGK